MATLSECITAANRLEQLDKMREEVTDSIRFDTPMLDAYADKITKNGLLRARDGLRVSAAAWRSWDFGPHSSGAYLDGTVGLVIERDGVTSSANAKVRYCVTRNAHEITCPEWEATDGTLRTFTVHVEGANLPNAAHRLLNTYLHNTWCAVRVGDVWSECLAFHVTNMVLNAARGRIAPYQIARAVENYAQAVTA